MAARYPHHIFTVYIYEDHFKHYGYPGTLQGHAILGHSTLHSQYPSKTWNELAVETIWLDVFHPDLARICSIYDVIHDLSMKRDKDHANFARPPLHLPLLGAAGKF
jgi:hypothetical protein